MLTVAGGDQYSRDAYAIPVSRLREAWPAVLADRTIPSCPYRGLDAFTAEDAEEGLYVGRDADIGHLRKILAGQPLVVVTGPSGVGKSSLVNAGLIHLLRREGWIAESFGPGAAPFTALAAALLRAVQPDDAPTLDSVGRLESRLYSDGLARLGSELAAVRRAPIVLCADQFEQVLDPGICSSETKEQFLDVVFAMSVARSKDVRLICVLRADFLSLLLNHPGASGCLRDRLFPLSPMGREELERVIAEPAASRGVQYENGLVSLIAGDAGDGTGLPLLEFALTQLWRYQRQRRISLAEYREIRGVAGALTGYAERVYQELLGIYPEERIRRVMLALVRSRRGASEATRRVVSREQLGQDWEIATALAERRLVALGHDPVKNHETAEIAHEALILEWPTLASWVNGDAEFQQWLATLEQRVADGDVLPDTRLAEADRWLTERPADIPNEVRLLVERSKSEWRRRVTELEEARNRAEDAARQAETRRLAADRLTEQLSAAVQHTRRLQQATSMLAEAITVEQVVEVITEVGRSAIGAKRSTIAVLDPERLRLRTINPSELPDIPGAPRAELPLRVPSVMTAAILARRPLLIENPDDLRKHFEDGVELFLAHTDEQAWVGLPLLSSGAPLGALRFSFTRPRKITDEERVFLEALAGQCVIALERASLFEREHNTAETLQRSLLPDSLPTVPGIILEARYLPVTRNMEIGGDWYDALWLPDNKLMVTVGDVMGKGLTAAAGMGRIRNGLRALATTDPQPKAVLEGLDRLFFATEHPEQITRVACLVLDPLTGEGVVGSAGHLPPLLVSVDTAPHLELVEPDPPLGWPSSRQQYAFGLPPGNTAVLYSDGLVANRRRRLAAGLEELVAVAARAPANAVENPAMLLDYLVDRMLAGYEQDDDVSVIAVRRTSGPTTENRAAGKQRRG